MTTSTLRSGVASLRRAFGSSDSEKDDVVPTFYLVIQETVPQRYAVSWMIWIRMPAEADYVFDVVKDPKRQAGYYVREERRQDTTFQSKSFKTIKIGTIPYTENVKTFGVGHVANLITTVELVQDKPHSVSTVWVEDVLDRGASSRGVNFINFEEGAKRKFEKQITEMGKKINMAKTKGILES